MEEFWSSCPALNHSPGAGVAVPGGQEVGHSGAEHSHQGTAVGEVKSQGFLAAHDHKIWRKEMEDDDNAKCLV